jgi:hypothetical protein
MVFLSPQKGHSTCVVCCVCYTLNIVYGTRLKEGDLVYYFGKEGNGTRETAKFYRKLGWGTKHTYRDEKQLKSFLDMGTMSLIEVFRGGLLFIKLHFSNTYTKELVPTATF